MTTATDPVKTGSVTLDGIAKEVGEIDLNLRKIVDEVKLHGDEAVKRATEELAKQRTDLTALGDRLAQIDVDLKMDKREVEQFNIWNLMRACALEFETKGRLSKKEVSPYEFEVTQQAHRDGIEQRSKFRQYVGSDGLRDMGTTDDELGGALIPVGPARNFLELLRAKLVLASLGAQFVTDLQGHKLPLTVGPSQGVTSYWVGETGTATASDIKWETRYMTPKRLACEARVAQNLVRWSPMAVQQMIEQDMIASMARAIQTAAIYGSGSVHTPKGLTLDPDIQTMHFGGSGDRYKRRHVFQARKLLLAADLDVMDDSVGTLMSPSIWYRLLTEGVDQWDGQSVDDGMPVHNVNLSDANLRALLGRYQVSSFVSETNSPGTLADVIHGDWRFLTIGQWGGIRVRASDVAGDSTGSAYRQEQIWLIANCEMDAMARRPNAFVWTNDATTTG